MQNYSPARGESIHMKKLLCAVLLICQSVFAANLGIIPTPQEVTLHDGVFRFSAKADFELVGNLKNIKKGREILSGALAETGAGCAEKITLVILEKKDDFSIDNIGPGKLSGAYVLEISPEKILIRSGTDRGLFYGLMSVTQLVKATDD